MKTWTEFDEKYREVIGSIGRSNAVGENDQADLGVARQMLIDMVENSKRDAYKGVPSGFNWEDCSNDIASIREAIKAGK